MNSRRRKASRNRSELSSERLPADVVDERFGQCWHADHLGLEQCRNRGDSPHGQVRSRVGVSSLPGRLPQSSGVHLVFTGSGYAHPRLSWDVRGRSQTIETTDSLGCPGTGPLVHTVGVNGSSPLAPTRFQVLRRPRVARPAAFHFLSKPLDSLPANSSSKSSFAAETHSIFRVI
jgi:hypothetical protein